MSDKVTTSDAMARQLVAAFLTGIVLLLPLRAALGTTTYHGLYLSLLVAIVVILAFGWVLRRSGVPSGMSLSAATAGTYACMVLIAIGLLPQFGPPGDSTQVALITGLPAAALAAPVATAIVGLATERTGARALATWACVLGFLVAASVGPEVNQNLVDARRDAELASQLEDSGLSPLLPDLDGMTAEYFTTQYTSEQGRRAVGYGLRYEPDDISPDNYDSSHISIDVTFPDGSACDPNAGVTCREGDGYVVVERDGSVDSVVVDSGWSRLTARFYPEDQDLPDPDEVGKALAQADEVEWLDVVSAEND